MRLQMAVLTMNRDRILRLCQCVDQLDLLLTGMAGYMCILLNDLCTLCCQLVDNLGYILLIARNRTGAEDNGISRLDRDTTVQV